MNVRDVGKILRMQYRIALNCYHKAKKQTYAENKYFTQVYTTGYLNAINDLLECYGLERETYNDLYMIPDLYDRCQKTKDFFDQYYNININLKQ